MRRVLIGVMVVTISNAYWYSNLKFDNSKKCKKEELKAIDDLYITHTHRTEFCKKGTFEYNVIKDHNKIFFLKKNKNKINKK